MYVAIALPQMKLTLDEASWFGKLFLWIIRPSTHKRIEWLAYSSQKFLSKLYLFIEPHQLVDNRSTQRVCGKLDNWRLILNGS